MESEPGVEADPEMSQQDQAHLLVEPSFTHRLDDEDALLEAEFGPPDDAGFYGRQSTADPENPDPDEGGAP